MNLTHLMWFAMRASRDDLRELVVDVSEMGKLHFQIFCRELTLERQRLKQKLLLFIIGCSALLVAIFFTFGGIIMIMWDTPYRLYALLGVLLFLWAAVAAIAYVLSRKSAPAFAQTVQELKRDSAWLMSLL